jgi:stage II sporulation protein AA (anti-sigma F factor antagonist)
MPDEQPEPASPFAAGKRESFVVNERSSDRKVTLALVGELDVACSASFEELVRRVCARGPDSLLLDLSELAFMDSSGLRVVLVTNDLCQQGGIELEILPGTPQVQRIFEVTGVLDTMPFRGHDGTS